MLDLTHRRFRICFYPIETPESRPSPDRCHYSTGIVRTSTMTLKVQFQIVSPTKTSDISSLHHPWTLGKKYPEVCLRSHIIDRPYGKMCASLFFSAAICKSSTTNILSAPSKSDALIIGYLQPRFASGGSWLEVRNFCWLSKRARNPAHPMILLPGCSKPFPYLISACTRFQARIQNDGCSRAEQLNHQGLDFVQTENQRLQEEMACMVVPIIGSGVLQKRSSTPWSRVYFCA